MEQTTEQKIADFKTQQIRMSYYTLFMRACSYKKVLSHFNAKTFFKGIK